MRALIRTPYFLAFVALVFVGCDSGEDELASGEFEATATGAVDTRFRGDAYFVAAPDGFLTLILSAGPSQTALPAPGLQLSAPWDGEPGTLALGSDVFFDSGFVILSAGPPQIFEVSAGTVTVTAASADQVEGTFDVDAVDVNQPSGSKAVRVEGAFIAVPAPFNPGAG